MGLSILLTPLAREKIALVDKECRALLKGETHNVVVPTLPARDLDIVPNHMLPPRPGLQSPEGQARLLHDLANIELQAMELGIRTLREFLDAPCEFREELSKITRDEARHFGMCIDGIEQLGFRWGQWPAHANLWEATSSNDTLLERIFIVHCYLEGSGLDSSDLILKKLSGVVNKIPRDIVNVIAEEEIGHVQFGLKWFRKLSGSDQLFATYLENLKNKIPHRAVTISPSARKKAGFTAHEIHSLQVLRSSH